jgi:hypothetical protein
MLRGKAVTLTAIRMSQRAIGRGRYPGEQRARTCVGLDRVVVLFPFFLSSLLGIASARFDKPTSKNPR